MRLVLLALLFFVSATIGLAQTPVAEGPLGKISPAPNMPNIHPKPYDPPRMSFVPGGGYKMGDHAGTGELDELPLHPVFIDAFYMDVFEVTNQEYCTFLNAAWKQELIHLVGGVVYQKKSIEPYCDTTIKSTFSRITWNGSAFGVTAGMKDHPMVMVSWYGAAAYANWRSAKEGLTPCYDLNNWECDFTADGLRLPTEAEWEKAARGGEYNPYYSFPWGDVIDGSKGNFWKSGDPYEATGAPETSPIGYYDGGQIPPGVDMANGYGLYDMAGNAWEWCNDWYNSDYYEYCVINRVYDNPTGPMSYKYKRVLRGGTWGSADIFLRCAARGAVSPEYRWNTSGFRLVVPPSSP